MHFNYFFLSKLAKSLNQRLAGAKILECFSQNKNELIITTLPVNEMKFFHIRIDLNPNYSFVNFPENFYRSKRNSISLFEKITAAVIAGIRVINNDRSLIIEFTNTYSLLLKFHGNQSNVILLEDFRVVSLFRKKLLKDKTLEFESLEKQINYSKNYFLTAKANLDEYPTLGPFVKKRIKMLWQSAKSIDEQWKIFHKILLELEGENIYILREEGKLMLSLIKMGTVISTHSDPLTALNEFAAIFTRENNFNLKKKHAENLLRYEEKIHNQSLQSLTTSLQKLAQQKNYKVYADLLMANLHKINPYDSEVTLSNFTDNSEITIPLKMGLTPQKNAENYYRKSKNQNIQITKNKELVKLKEKSVKEIRSSLELLNDAGTVKEIEEIIAPFEKLKADKSKSHPYKTFHFMDFEIRVGKNAKSNDLTTFKHSYKEDLWLHVKDAGGSHVIVKYKSGMNFPRPVIERAAQLAAFNSKRKTETLCPVIYTPKKFVRKRKGDPAGVVVVENEKVLLVEPKF